MSDKSFVLNIPEQLLQLAQAANIDLHQTMIEALERKIQAQNLTPRSVLPMNGDAIQPSLAEIEAAIKASEARVASGEYPLRQIGYLQDQLWISDDFDDELPESFWLGDEH